jgi:hypothetical protein
MTSPHAHELDRLNADIARIDAEMNEHEQRFIRLGNERRRLTRRRAELEAHGECPGCGG